MAAAGCSRPLTFSRPLTSHVDVNDIKDLQRDFIEKLIEDEAEAETYYCLRRYGAMECRFAGYRCDDVRLISISPHSTCHKQVKSFAINSIAVHGSKAICVVIRHKDVNKACIGPFYRGFTKEDVMYYLTSAIMSDVADLAEPLKPYSVVSWNYFRGKKMHEPSIAVEETIKFLSEKMNTSCSEYGLDKTIETAISAFQLLCPHELTTEDLYVFVCEDINLELAPYYLMPNVIEDILMRGSS